MENLFNFEYEVQTIKHKSGEDSRHSIVYGQDGHVVHTKKDSYTLIPTSDVSKLADSFMGMNYEVSPFVYKKGAVIGLSILFGSRPTAVGEKVYRAIVNIPNNGWGRGRLSISELRLICENGAMRNTGLMQTEVKIPHSKDYADYLEIAKQAISSFVEIIVEAEEQDEALNKIKIDKLEAKRELNVWFYNNEVPASLKKDLSLEDFRKALAIEFDTLPNATQNRYNLLLDCFKKELGYNEELDLECSKYTVFATATNYLSRRREASSANAPEEVLLERQAEKIKELVRV